MRGGILLTLVHTNPTVLLDTWGFAGRASFPVEPWHLECFMRFSLVCAESCTLRSVVSISPFLCCSGGSVGWYTGWSACGQRGHWALIVLCAASYVLYQVLKGGGLSGSCQNCSARFCHAWSGYPK